jgi:2-succinyl-5-enolpyruvyl-6-hydroxy-3-cyclohexene-1-carboxylate synthase
MPAALVDEFVRAGITDAVVSPGSRSTLLALACAERLRTHVVVDERSAAFFALGFGRASGRPAVLVSTSGTAAANYYPAIKEADLSSVPMVVCTADRPAELRDTGAPQTMDQQHLFGSAVRWYADPGPPDDRPESARLWRSVGARASAEAVGPVAGPVHLNLPLREPFLSSEPVEPPPGRHDGRPWTEARFAPGAPDDAASRLESAIGEIQHGVVVVGQDAAVDAVTLLGFATAIGWPVLADPLSGMRRPGTITTYDALARSAEWARRHRPEAVLRLGRPPTSKALTTWLEQVPLQMTLAATPSWADPTRSVAMTLGADPTAVLDLVASRLDRGPRDWSERWATAERAARDAMDSTLDGFEELTEPRIARDVTASLPAGAWLLAASSMPVRDVESFAVGRADAAISANRGVNGIDGLVSTAQGMAAATGAPVAALLGDLAFLHDSNGLLGATDRGVAVTYIVVDNDGGGIFSFLPQANLERFETLFATPHGVDLAALAAVHGVVSVAPSRPDEVGPAVAEAMAEGGIRLVHLRTDRSRNVAVHRGVFDAVAAAVGDQAS